jgi:hypothetical protein
MAARSFFTPNLSPNNLPSERMEPEKPTPTPEQLAQQQRLAEKNAKREARRHLVQKK